MLLVKSAQRGLSPSAPFQSLFGRQFVVVSAFTTKNHSCSLGVLMPEERLYYHLTIRPRNPAGNLPSLWFTHSYIVFSFKACSIHFLYHCLSSFGCASICFLEQIIGLNLRYVKGGDPIMSNQDVQFYLKPYVSTFHSSAGLYSHRQIQFYNSRIT